ncbi:MAG: LamG-like jellyroll fold domain-containing protein, partial [Pirellulaceae bacterium]
MATTATRKEPRSKSRNNRHAASRRLLLERLENRELLAVISHWTGDNTAADSEGSNHGTLINGTTYAAGQVGQAFKLDGINDRIGVADSPSLALTGSLTIEGWIRTDMEPTAQHGNVFFRGDDRGGLDPYWLSLEPGGHLLFQVESLKAAAGISAPLPIGRFVHVAATLDDSTGNMRLYLNGALKAEGVTAVRPFDALDPASNPGIGIGNHG